MVNTDVTGKQFPRIDPRPVYPRIMSLDLEYTKFNGEPIALGLSIQEAIPTENGDWIGGETGHWFTLVDHIEQPCEFVLEHVLPVITQPYDGIEPGNSLARGTVNQMWHTTHGILSSMGFKVVAHVPMPIETGFLSAIHAAHTDHPFPLIDICSMILGSGYRGDPTELDTWWGETVGDLPSWYVPHHPLADARLAGLAYWDLMSDKYRRQL